MDDIESLSCLLVNPSKKLLSTPKGTKLAASSLKVTSHRVKDGHFFLAAVPDKCSNIIKAKMRADLAAFSNEHLPRVYSTCAEILTCKARLVDGSARNETETRYAICTPLINLLCDTFGYLLKLEETTKDHLSHDYMEEELYDDCYLDYATDMWEQFKSTSAEPSTSPEPEPSGEIQHSPMAADIQPSIGKLLSKNNKPDYCVYSLIKATGTKGRAVKIVAIIDAKQNLGIHALAQIIGYYCAFDTGSPNPLVVLITQDHMRLLLFPFASDGIKLVNAIAISEIALWENAQSLSLNIDVLKLFLSIGREESHTLQCVFDPSSCDIPQDGQIPKDKIENIVSEKQRYEDLSKQLNRERRQRILEKKRADCLEKRADCLEKQLIELKEQLKRT